MKGKPKKDWVARNFNPIWTVLITCWIVHQFESNICEAPRMSTLVHSRGGGGQNWLNFGPRSSWMTPYLTFVICMTSSEFRKIRTCFNGTIFSLKSRNLWSRFVVVFQMSEQVCCWISDLSATTTFLLTSKNFVTCGHRALASLLTTLEWVWLWDF